MLLFRGYRRKELCKLIIGNIWNSCTKDVSLQKICDQFDNDFNLEIGSALKYFRHFIARKLITVNMAERIIIAKLTITDIEINKLEEGEIDYISS